MTALLLITPALILAAALPETAEATTLDWLGLDPAWDDMDTSGQQDFSDVGGSGIDISVSYSDNMFSRNSVPDIYTADFAPSSEIVGSLRFTNDRDTLRETTVTITFSQDVLITDLGTVSLSTILGQQENIIVEALDASGVAVLATTYGTNTAGLVELDTDGDGAYRSRGLGAQEDGLYGDTFYTYTDFAVRTLRFTNFVTEIGADTIALGFSSQGIRNVEFSAVGAPVPEPSAAMLIGLGLLLLGGRSATGRREEPERTAR